MERKLYQLRFDDDFKIISPEEVGEIAYTIWPVVKSEKPPYPPEPGGRFVRELPDEERIMVIDPEIASHYFVDHIFNPFAEFEQEELWTLMLNTKNRLTHTAMIYRGSINMITIRTAEIFRAAVRVNATAIILGHNHPSGEAKVSLEDVQVTRAVNEAGQILGVELLDHVVVGRGGSWTSLKRMGMGFDL